MPRLSTRLQVHGQRLRPGAVMPRHGGHVCLPDLLLNLTGPRLDQSGVWHFRKPQPGPGIRRPLSCSGDEKSASLTGRRSEVVSKLSSKARAHWVASANRKANQHTVTTYTNHPPRRMRTCSSRAYGRCNKTQPAATLRRGRSLSRSRSRAGHFLSDRPRVFVSLSVVVLSDTARHKQRWARDATSTAPLSLPCQSELPIGRPAG